MFRGKYFGRFSIGVVWLGQSLTDQRGTVVGENIPKRSSFFCGHVGFLAQPVMFLNTLFGRSAPWLERSAPITVAGLDIVLMETRQVKGALKAMPIKTDRRDAEGIARLLHLGWFCPVHCKSVSAREARAILSARKAIQQNMITLEMSLRGIVRNFGLKVGAISRGRFEHRIRELTQGNVMLEAATGPMLHARMSLRPELASLERLVRQMAQDDPICIRLMTMPGVGAVVALTYQSAIDDPARFASSKMLGPGSA